jgi:hypothetical protein
MSTELSLFKKANSVANKLLKDIPDALTDKLAGSGGVKGRRLSIKGSAFRQIIDGKEVAVSEENYIDVVMINAAPVQRMYFEGEFQDGVAAKPLCWSDDTQTPAKDVPAGQKQAGRCMDCPQNIKGSGKGESRACRYSQRVAVLLDGEIEDKEVYQLQLPATSIFGDVENGKMPLQAYARFLKSHGAHAISLVTRMKFDKSATAPKLTFSAIRPLDEAELEAALEMREHEDTIAAITRMQADLDSPEEIAKDKPIKKATQVVEEDDEDDEEEVAPPSVKKKRVAEETPVVEEEDEEEDDEPEMPRPAKKTFGKKAKPEPVEDDEEEEPPTKRSKKGSTPPPAPAAEDDDLNALLDEWDN